MAVTGLATTRSNIVVRPRPPDRDLHDGRARQRSCRCGCLAERPTRSRLAARRAEISRRRGATGSSPRRGPSGIRRPCRARASGPASRAGSHVPHLSSTTSAAKNSATGSGSCPASSQRAAYGGGRAIGPEGLTLPICPHAPGRSHIMHTFLVLPTRSENCLIIAMTDVD